MIKGRAFGVRTAQLRQLWNLRSTTSGFSCIGQCSNPRVSGIVKHEAACVTEILRGINAKEIKELHEELHEWLARMDLCMESRTAQRSLKAIAKAEAPHNEILCTAIQKGSLCLATVR